MTAAARTALRERQYTYYEVIAFAQFYQLHRTENSPENLLAAFLKWKQITGVQSTTTRRLLIIEEIVVTYYGLNLQDVRGKRRYTELVRARQVIAYFTVKYASQNQVANALGSNRNNIQFGKTKCALLMETEPLLRKEVAEIEKRLEQPMADIAAEEKRLAQNTNVTGEEVKDADKEGEQVALPT